MKRFQFRLERLQRVRHTQERIERERWAAAEAGAQEASRRADLAAAAFERGLDDVRSAQGANALQPAEVVLAQDAVRRLAALTARERAIAARRRAEAEAARVPWLAKRAEVEGLERWRVRELASHRREAEEADARDMDEIAGVRAARARRGAPGGPAHPTKSRSTPDSPDSPNDLR